jgi:hypothetical protein
MAEESKTLSFAQTGQLLKPIPEIHIPASSNQWRRWMDLLKQSAKPPVWLSESLAYLFLGIAATAVFGAVDKWTGELWKTVDSVEEPIARNWFTACGYSIIALSFMGVGIYAFFGSRHIKQQDANFAALVCGEMEEIVKTYMNALAQDEKDRKKRAKEQAVQSKTLPPPQSPSEEQL